MAWCLVKHRDNFTFTFGAGTRRFDAVNNTKADSILHHFLPLPIHTNISLRSTLMLSSHLLLDLLYALLASPIP
jgi:hypothetical protein